jgi:uncharacterized protein (TIGR02597 family)
VEILPDQYFTARQAAGVPTTTNVAPGQVVLSKIRIPLYMIVTNVSGSPQQDNYVAIYRPAPQTLIQSGLTNAFVKSTLASAPKDQVLTYDNTVQGKNKSTSASYFYYKNAWRLSGADTKVDYGNTTVFTPGMGVIIRKASNTVSTVTNWVNQANYSN